MVELPPLTLKNAPAAPPVIHTPIREEAVTINNISINKILLSWTPVTGVTQYQVQYRFQNTNWVTEIVFRPDIEIMNSQAGTYDIKVFSFNAAGQLSSTPSKLKVTMTMILFFKIDSSSGIILEPLVFILTILTFLGKWDSIFL